MALSADEQAELDALKADLALVRTAYRAILSGAQSYKVDTSQTSATFTKANLKDLLALRNTLRSEIAELSARSSGGAGAIRVNPSW